MDDAKKVIMPAAIGMGEDETAEESKKSRIEMIKQRKKYGKGF